MITASKKILAPLALVTIVAVSGCSAGQSVTAADVIAKMRDSMKNTQTVQGTVEVSVNINKDGIKTLIQSVTGMQGNAGTDGAAGHSGMMSKGIDSLPDTASASLLVWKQSPDKARVEVASSSIPGVKGATLVFDGQKGYAYDPTHNKVYTGTPSKLIDKMPDQLKAALQNLDPDTALDTLLNATDIKLAGTEKVAGFEAYRLDLTPKPDAAEKLGLPDVVKMQAGIIIKDARASVWVDKNRSVPLKFTLKHPNIGQLTVAASALELNKPIDASRFVLQVPGGAATVDLDAKADEHSSTTKSLTLPQAREQATKDGWKLLEPAYVPAGATLVEVRQMGMASGDTANHGTKSGFLLAYRSAAATFTIMEGKGQLLSMLGDGFSGRNNGGVLKDVQLRGVTAKAFAPAGSNFAALFWQEKESGAGIAVHGNGLSLDEAVKIAESLK